MSGVVVLGSLNLDHIVVVATLPAPGETLLSDDYSMVPGGKGRNQAVAVAAVGGRAWMAGAVGDDEAGELLLADITRRGVATSFVRQVSGVATGLALITVDGQGENTIVVHPGANACVEPIAGDTLDPSGHAVLLCSLEVPLVAVAASAASAQARGLTTIVNAAPMVGASDGRLAAIVDHTDILIVNRSEAAVLVGAGPGDGLVGAGPIDDLVTAIHGWRPPGGPEVIITLGAEGAVRVGDDGTIRYPAFPVRARSTVGAGDTFAGVLSAGLAEGRNLDAAITRAGAAAAAFVAGDLSRDRINELLSTLTGGAPQVDA